jgi:nicotinate-nucleotide pyrophosphorylase (carboxylating)
MVRGLPIRHQPLTIGRMSLEITDAIRRLVKMAKDEDLGPGDLSAGLLPDSHEGAAFRLLAERPGVFAGRAIADEILHAYDTSIEIAWTAHGVDGRIIEVPSTELAMIRGPLGAVLSAERVLLNFLQRLSGIATQTRHYVDAVAGTGATIFDTRKTTPGWRALEKYAVRCGGGENHRQGLYDAVLIKDNHLAGVEPGRLAGAVFEMLDQLSTTGRRPAFVMVEADTLEQVEELFKVVGIDVILLDNFSLEQLIRAVELRRSRGLTGKIAFEASGGVTLETIRAVAETGVERISVGAITHSAPAYGLSLERVG